MERTVHQNQKKGAGIKSISGTAGSVDGSERFEHKVSY
jgi:hypothetical protein